MIKSAASAASPKTKPREARPRGAPRGRCPSAEPSPGRSRLASLDLVFGEAALAADLITASKSKQRTPPKSQKHRKGFPKVSKTQERGPKPFKTFSNPFKPFQNLFKPFQNPSRASPGSENHKKGIPNHQKEVRNFPKPSKTTKSDITRQIRIQITHF